MNTVDIVIVALLGLGFYFGYKKGFLYQISSIVGFSLAYIFTAKLFLFLHNYLINEGFLNETSSKWISYALTFVGIIVLVKILTKLIVSFLKTLGVNFVNKFAGGCLGSAKWLIFMSLLVYVFYDLNIFQIESLSQSEFLPYIYQIGKQLISLV